MADETEKAKSGMTTEQGQPPVIFKGVSTNGMTFSFTVYGEESETGSRRKLISGLAEMLDGLLSDDAAAIKAGEIAGPNVKGLVDLAVRLKNYGK